MPLNRLHAFLACAASALLLAACGGGGGSAADVRPNEPPPPAEVVEGPKEFLLFPNPQRQADGRLQTDTREYAEAYYRAIDPANARDTLAKWKAVNGWDSGTGTQYTVVFGDRRDLGYGRRMNVRQAPDGTLSFFVENYLIEAGAGYAYSPLNLDAAVVRDTRWMIGVNAIEFTPGPDGGAPFPKFYNFDPVTGERNIAVDLDGRGDKFMPGPCITCHGGRGDALTPPDATGRPRFNLVQNGESRARGDVQAHLHPFEPDAFGFSTRAGFSRAEQEATIKAINRLILCSYPIRTPSGAPEDACRRLSNEHEWQGTAAAFIKSAYGGTGLPSATFNDRYVPDSWEQAGQSTLYLQVVAPYCRACHVMRGSAGNSDLDFDTYEKFRSYAERIRHHVFERGNMPLARIVYEAFWASPDGPRLLSGFLQGQGFPVRTVNGAVAQPGRPVSDPGPDRVVAPGATRLSAEGSLFATRFAWTLASGPAGATLTDAGTANPTFTATTPGTYVLQLVASSETAAGTPAQVQVVVDPRLAPAPAAIRFADIKGQMQGNNLCTTCHTPGGTVPRPPVFYGNEDRNGDGAVDATDDEWFYAEVRSRINFNDIAASPLLRKPSGQHHGGNQVAGFDTSRPPGDPARARYDLFLNWILNGAPR